MQDLLLFGLQGSGKGTQSQRLAEKYGYQIFETGGQLRRLATENSPLGQKVKAIIESGQLVPTETVMEIVADFLTHLPAGQAVIFDGIPRSEEQRMQLNAELAKVGRQPLAVHIHLTETEALRRLLGRRTCSSCRRIFGTADNLPAGAACPACGGELKVRADDTEEAIQTRLAVFARETLPVIEKYGTEGRLVEVEGDQPVDAVTAALNAALAR